MKTTFTAAAIATLVLAAAPPVLAQQGTYAGAHALYQDVAIPAGAAGGGSGGTRSDDVIVDGRIITGENPASARGGAAPNGKLYVGTDHGVYGASSGGLGDGSVRGLSTGVGSGTYNAPKTGSLGSLAGVGSVGQLASPPGAPAPQATNNLKQIGLGLHNYDSSRSGGDVNGDGVKDVIVGTGAGGGPHVKSGPGGGPHIKAIDPVRAAGPTPGGVANMKTVDTGNAARVDVGGVVKGFTLTSKGQAR